MQIYFLQPFLIIFTRGMINSGLDCIYQQGSCTLLPWWNIYCMCFFWATSRLSKSRKTQSYEFNYFFPHQFSPLLGLESEEIKPADNLLQLQHSEKQSSLPPAYNVGHFYLPITVSVEQTSTKSLKPSVCLKPLLY